MCVAMCSCWLVSFWAAWVTFLLPKWGCHPSPTEEQSLTWSHEWCGLRLYHRCWSWCQHHHHLLVNQYWHTSFISDEAPIADAWGKGLALLPFPAGSARRESDSESEKLNKLPQSIGVLLSCFCRRVSSFWRPMSLASSSVILKLACTNFSSAF